MPIADLHDGPEAIVVGNDDHAQRRVEAPQALGARDQPSLDGVVGQQVNAAGAIEAKGHRDAWAPAGVARSAERRVANALS